MRDFNLLPNFRFDGEAGRIVPGGRIAVRDGRVVAPEAAGEGSVPEVRGGLAVEPLSDVHAHLFLSGAFDPAQRAQVMGLPREEAVARAVGLATRYRVGGIGVVRDGGDPHGIALEAAAQAAQGVSALLLPSGEPLFRKGGYGGFLGRGVEPSEAQCLMEENRRKGATQVKVLGTGLNSLERAGEVGPTQFSADEAAHLGRLARDAGLPLMLHANGPLETLFPAGPFSIEHAFWCRPEDLARMAGEGIYWTPTFRAWAALADHPALTEAQKVVVSETAKRHAEEIALGIRLGTRLLVGSDAGTPGVEHVLGFFDEFQALMSAGAPPEALLAESVAFARRHLGSKGLRVGDEADFSLYGHPPSAQAPLEPPLRVYCNGQWHSSSDTFTSSHNIKIIQ